MIKTLLSAAGVALLLTFIAQGTARAADGSWDGGSTANGNWATAQNWIGDPTAPGATTGTTNPDIATFNAAIANSWGLTGTPVVTTLSMNIGGISFDKAAGSYFIGSTGGNAIKLSSGGAIQILNTLTATNATETINAPLAIQAAGGGYTFANNSANGTGAGAGTLNIGGGITGGAAGATVLTLGGSNTNSTIPSSSQTAWAMLHRFRKAMVRPGRDQITGTVEADETFIGGCPSAVAEIIPARLC